MDGANVEQMNVVTTGTLYVKGDILVFESGTGNTVTLTLNSIQAAMLNGELHAFTELPIEAGDEFKAVITVKNHADQKNVSGVKLSVSGDLVDRPYLLHMKMV